MPAKSVGTVDTGRVTATVAAEMTEGRRDGPAEMIGEAARTGSVEGEDEQVKGERTKC